MKIQNYKQSTVESCLTCCLYQLAGQKIKRDNELAMLFYALKFNKKDFVAGHLDLLEKKTKLKTIRYVHNKTLYDIVKNTSTTSLKQEKINIKFIDKILKNKPLILVLDMYQIFREYHYPHWVLLLEKKNKKYIFYEPWEGVIKEISEKELKESIISYLNRLWMAPQIITLE